MTKRGRPVAKVVPMDSVKPKALRGSVTYLTDIIAPIGDEWPVDE